MAGTPLLAAPEWQPAGPVPLRRHRAGVHPAASRRRGRAPPRSARPVAPLLPERPDGTRYRSYSDALRDLAAPAMFENRPTYRLIEADLGKAPAGVHPRPLLRRRGHRRGGRARVRRHPARRPARGLRARIADPCDLGRRPVNLAVTTLTLRFEAATGRASFLLHWRDPAKVGHAGGMYQVIPVGIFQPSGEASWHEREDFSLWRCMLREFDEELRGTPEEYGAGPVDYASWPFARHMAAALDRGQVRVWCLGLGVDPLTYATDLLTVAVIDSRVFDELFRLDPRGNAEGRVLAARKFAAHVIDRIVTTEPVQAAAAAVLRLAWRHRDTLTVLPRRLVTPGRASAPAEGPPGPGRCSTPMMCQPAVCPRPGPRLSRRRLPHRVWLRPAQSRCALLRSRR